jgi:hypothetical protein
MKKHGKSANMYVMFGLLAVLFISLGYLSMQKKEGMGSPIRKSKEQQGFKGGKEGLMGATEAACTAPNKWTAAVGVIPGFCT